MSGSPLRGIEGKQFIQDHVTSLFERRDVSSASFPPTLPFSWQAHRGRNLISLFTSSCCFSRTLSTRWRTTLKCISHPPFAMFWGSLKFLWFCSEALTWQPCNWQLSSPWKWPRTTLEKAAKFQVKAWHGSQQNYLNKTFNKRLVQCHNTYLTELELFFSKSFCLQTSIVSSFIKQV